MKKTSFLLPLGFVVVLVAAAYTGYVYWQQHRIDSELETLDQSLQSYNEELLEIENQQVMQAVFAQEATGELRATVVLWSKIVDRVRDTVPVEDGVPLADILSYSGSAGRDISVSARTSPESEDPYFDVADLVKEFAESDYFENVFVSSISESTDADGNDILNFPLRFGYVGEDGEEVVEAVAR